MLGCHDGQLNPVRPEKSPQVIHTGNMIRVRVGDQNRINFFQSEREKLVSDIWASVNKDGRAACFNKHGTALTLVARV
jgi:hypothetical protein